MKIAAIYHVPFERLGYIEDWIRMRGHSLAEYHVYENQALPESSEFDLLVCMGGPMSVYEEIEYPWLIREKKLIRHCRESGKAVLGICLGAQLIAGALGCDVYRGQQKEIGWFPVAWKQGASFIPDLTGETTVFHWHGDTFDLPAGAFPLASSVATPNQGFLAGDRILAIQFHPEVKPENISLMVNHSGNELVGGPFIQEAAGLLSGLEYIPAGNLIMGKILTYFENLLTH